MRILIAEDEIELARGLKYLLERNKFSVDIVHDGEEALGRFGSSEYDVVVLDIMMPKKDGLEVLDCIRKGGSNVPVMMLTAKAEIEDRVAGLEAGADDYLPKPFASREFIARVKALSRRSGRYEDLLLTFGDLRLDCNRYELTCGGDGAAEQQGVPAGGTVPEAPAFRLFRQPSDGQDLGTGLKCRHQCSLDLHRIRPQKAEDHRKPCGDQDSARGRIFVGGSQMLKKMQRRFILAAMAAFGAVLLILLVGINVANYFQATSMQDRMARNLLGYEKGAAGRSETPFPTRFFAVHCDAAGNVRFVSRDYLSSAEEEEAVIDYAREVLAGGR